MSKNKIKDELRTVEAAVASPFIELSEPIRWRCYDRLMDMGYVICDLVDAMNDMIVQFTGSGL